MSDTDYLKCAEIMIGQATIVPNDLAAVGFASIAQAYALLELVKTLKHTNFLLSMIAVDANVEKIREIQ